MSSSSPSSASPLGRETRASGPGERAKRQTTLEHFFRPRSVAIVGASESSGKVGNLLLLGMQEGGYKGKVYPINPNASQLAGLKAYPSVLNVEEDIDLAVVVVPRNAVLPVIEECGRKGIDSAIVITAGFKEMDSEGARLEMRLAERACHWNMRTLGPNCVGLIAPLIKLNATFLAGMPGPGKIAFLSQSGAICSAILDWSLQEGIGFSYFISLGNKADLDETDFMRALAEDEDTRVVLGYIEGISNGMKFVEVAQELARKKPFIVVKSGTTEAGARAASSHTGSLAGSERAFEAACRQAGLIRANSIEELFNYAKVFADQPIPRGPNVAIVTNAGGPGVMTADACARSQLSLTSFERHTIEALRTRLPATAAVYNPVDIVGDAGPDRYQAALEAVSADPKVDGMIVILTPQAMTQPTQVAKVVGGLRSRDSKPLVTSFMGGGQVARAIQVLKGCQVPNFPFPEDAVAALDALARYGTWLNRPVDTLRTFEDVDKEKVRKILARVRAEKRLHLSGVEAMEVMTAYGFHKTQDQVAATYDEAVAIAESLGYPVVMKVVSEEISHKSDIGGVVLGLSNSEEVEDAFHDIITRAHHYMPEATITGVEVQEMLQGGREIILGVSQDLQFGPMIMFGLGGIYVEVLKDVSFRLAPVGVTAAREMVSQIHAYPILVGVRGQKRADLEAIQEGLLRMSQLVMDFPEILEADINPLYVKAAGDGTVAVDSRLTIAED